MRPRTSTRPSPPHVRLSPATPPSRPPPRPSRAAADNKAAQDAAAVNAWNIHEGKGKKGSVTFGDGTKQTDGLIASHDVSPARAARPPRHLPLTPLLLPTLPRPSPMAVQRDSLGNPTTGVRLAATISRPCHRRQPSSL